MSLEKNIRNIFDYRDGKLYWKIRSSGCVHIGEEAGCINRGQNRWYIGYKGKLYGRSRLVFLWHHGNWPAPICDHINRDGSDDRIENLRAITQAENNRNISPHHPDTGRNISLAKTGKKRAPFSDEWKRNMGLSRLGKKRGPYKKK
jgi:HNH endonuclease